MAQSIIDRLASRFPNFSGELTNGAWEEPFQADPQRRREELLEFYPIFENGPFHDYVDFWEIAGGVWFLGGMIKFAAAPLPLGEFKKVDIPGIKAAPGVDVERMVVIGNYDLDSDGAKLMLYVDANGYQDGVRLFLLDNSVMPFECRQIANCFRDWIEGGVLHPFVDEDDDLD